MVWNIHKENLLPKFHATLKALIKAYPSTFLLFQEAKYTKQVPFELHEHSYALASNIETYRHLYGVMTAAQVQFDTVETKLTTKREIGVMTHKSQLITRHTLHNGQSLHLVNIHAINFVSAKLFLHELEMIKEMVRSIEGALIIGGDFNNWTNKRSYLLEEFQEEMGLKRAEVTEKKHIKHLFFKPLDHIFYRGVTLIQAEAINTGRVSDHNPIYATFTMEES